MKKNTIAITILFLAGLFLTANSFAARMDKSLGAISSVIEGKIISVDAAKNKFILKDNDDGREKTLFASARDMDSLVESATVEVTVSLGSNFASQIKK